MYERDTEEHRSLLAECYLHENQPYKACHILKECKSEFNRYMTICNRNIVINWELHITETKCIRKLKWH